MVAGREREDCRECGHYLPRLRVYDGDDGAQRDASQLPELSFGILQRASNSLINVLSGALEAAEDSTARDFRRARHR